MQMVDPVNALDGAQEHFHAGDSADVYRARQDEQPFACVDRSTVRKTSQSGHQTLIHVTNGLANERPAISHSPF